MVNRNQENFEKIKKIEEFVLLGTKAHKNSLTIKTVRDWDRIRREQNKIKKQIPVYRNI